MGVVHAEIDLQCHEGGQVLMGIFHPSCDPLAINPLSYQVCPVPPLLIVFTFNLSSWCLGRVKLLCVSFFPPCKSFFSCLILFLQDLSLFFLFFSLPFFLSLSRSVSFTHTHRHTHTHVHTHTHTHTHTL